MAERLDAVIAHRTADERFVTAVLVGVPPGAGPAEVVNCGHPPPLLRRTGTVREVTPPAYEPPLGLRELTGGRYVAGRIELRPGDLLLLYTDGISEARDAAGRFYPLAFRLAGLGEHDPGAQLDHLLADVAAYVGGGLTDDAALLAIRRDS